MAQEVQVSSFPTKTSGSKKRGAPSFLCRSFPIKTIGTHKPRKLRPSKPLTLAAGKPGCVSYCGGFPLQILKAETRERFFAPLRMTTPPQTAQEVGAAHRFLCRSFPINTIGTHNLRKLRPAKIV
jgi:hypothetical protein